MSHNTTETFGQWLTERCEYLKTLETEAEHALHGEKNTDKYTNLMRKKALFLQGLVKEAQSLAATLPPQTADLALCRLEQFSSNATRALEIGSIFFMSALLYPADHVKGQPNNLDLLAAEVLSLAGQEDV